jgi:hypothetical protein
VYARSRAIAELEVIPLSMLVKISITHKLYINNMVEDIKDAHRKKKILPW